MKIFPKICLKQALQAELNYKCRKAGTLTSHPHPHLITLTDLLRFVFQFLWRITITAIFKTGNGESGNGNGEWERGMGTGNLRGMTGESAGNLFLGTIEQ